MTDYYNSKEINNKHGVYFYPPVSGEYYYYVFEEKKWIKCYPIDNLPYNLCSFRLEGKDNDHCVVTSKDSYRLCKEIPEDITHEYMIQEKEWRDDILEKGKELDFNRNEKWVKAEVDWPKADIIPGVVLIGPMGTYNISFGYYYKESSRLAKSCTHTQVDPDKDF